jgi:hypothetical protein
MSTPSQIPGAARVLGLGASSLVCAVVAGGLLVFGQPAAALGVGLGLGLHLVNALLLYQTAQSLVVRDPSRASAVLAGVSSAGRLVLVGFTLCVIAATLGRETALGAGGGLALAQISLFFRRSGAK